MELKLRGISKSFGQNLVLDEIDLTVRGGMALGLLGRNGAGKTTTIRIIMQVFPPDSGTVSVDGRPVAASGVRFGYLPEERGLYPKKRVIDQLVYLGTLRGLTSKLAMESASRLLRRLEMSEYTDKKLEVLSKCNQQKIQLIAALVADPEIVILDEPFSGLDPVNAMLLKDVVKELIGGGKTVIFSSHQMNYVEEFCEEIAILHAGKIAVGGSIEGIRRTFPRDVISIKTDRASELARFAEDKLSDFALPENINGGGLDLRLRAESDKARLLSALGSAGLDIDGFAVKEPSLNDIFVKYTGGAL